MKIKRFPIVLAVLLVAGLGLLAWQLSRPHEPTYQGKPLTYWLQGYGNYIRRAGVEPDQAHDAVRAIGTNAIPYLLTLLRAKDSEFTSEAFQAVEHLPLLRTLYRPDWERHIQARWAFDALGADAKEVVPALIEVYDKNISESSRIATVFALDSIYLAANQKVPLLLQAMIADPPLRLRCVQYLEIDANKPAVLSALIMCLQDGDQPIRYTAIEKIRQLGTGAKPAIPALITTLADQNFEVRKAATNALRKIDPLAALKAGVK